MTTPPGVASPSNALSPGHSAGRRRTVLVLLGLAVLVAVLASLALGSRLVAPEAVWQALTRPDGSVESEVVRGLRVPRTVAALVVGACLGLAGTAMQALTRNPVADPGILGVNAGAGLAVVSTVALTGASDHLRNLVVAMLGALIASVAVQLLSGAGGRQGGPARLALAGVAVSAALSSLAQGVVLADQVAFNEFRFWVSGSLEGRGTDILLTAAPVLAAGTVLAIAIGPALGVIALGDEAATGLGVNVKVMRAAGLAAVAMLCGGATAVAGPLSFVGLAVPLVARRLVGQEPRWALGAAVLLGAVWVTVADVAARLVVLPREVPVGVVLALIGAPFFIALVRTRRGLS